jgi:NAD(P) transhydrogenase
MSEPITARTATRLAASARQATQDYDLVVIGSGPAGEKGAAQAAYFGKRVALVERAPGLGGAAANTGTLPSKTLRETALMLSGFRARGTYGIDLSLRRAATVQDFMHRAQQVTELEQRRVGANLDRHVVDVLRGSAAFVDAHTLEITAPGEAPRRIHAAVALIATGSSPRRPAELPDHERILDSDSILDLARLPRSLAVVGGGVIGCEYACTFAALGCQVTLIEARDVLLPFLDRELSVALKQAMVRLGVDMATPERVSSCHADDHAATITLASGRVVHADAVLVAAGRTSNTGELNLAAAGVAVGERGLVTVDEHFRTNVPHIYAAGDVVGFPALASTSMEQARLAMVHAFELKYKTALAPILPYGLYTIPEVSMAGETEESLQAKKIPYVVGRADYRRNARGMIIGDADGFLKLLFSRDGRARLLGVHAIGEQATELVHIGLTALMTESGAELFIKTCYNYPTLGELYKYATYDALGRMPSAGS